MKAYNKRGCYRFGGTLKTKTIHGVRTGNHSNPHVVKAAQRVEGESARPRLDRPARRADGGRISEDSKREAARLRRSSDDNYTSGMLRAGAGAVLGAASAATRRLPRLLTRLLTGAGSVSQIAGSGQDLTQSVKDEMEARRIERGQAEPGREDRNCGGAVKKGK